jgi:hypothetical protein
MAAVGAFGIALLRHVRLGGQYCILRCQIGTSSFMEGDKADIAGRQGLGFHMHDEYVAFI